MLAPPVDYVAIRVALVRAAIDATGLDQNHVIMSEPEAPNAPRPTLPYLALKFTSVGVRYGNDVPEANGATWTYKGPRMFVVSFHAYGESHEQAYGLMALWQAALGMESTRGLLAASGISVLLPGAVTDLSALQDTAYEGRAHMDCRFGVTSQATSDLGQITTVQVDGATTDPVQVTFGG